LNVTHKNTDLKRFYFLCFIVLQVRVTFVTQIKTVAMLFHTLHTRASGVEDL